MKTKERDEWVAALRDGEFEQTKHVLHDHKGYCCLGVACAIFAETLNLNVEKVTLMEERFEVYYNYQGTVMPQPVADLLGLRTPEGSFSEARMEGVAWADTLASINDSNATFKQIADILEKHEDLLFEEVSSSPRRDFLFEKV